MENNWLIRTKNTVPQKLLNGQERQNNLKKAFKAGQNDVKLNAIVIIDDIYTTGSTIDAMAAVLYVAVTYVIYTIRYAKAKKRLQLFLEYLDCLDQDGEEETAERK